MDKNISEMSVHERRQRVIELKQNLDELRATSEGPSTTEFDSSELGSSFATATSSDDDSKSSSSGEAGDSSYMASGEADDSGSIDFGPADDSTSTASSQTDDSVSTASGKTGDSVSLCIQIQGMVPTPQFDDLAHRQFLLSVVDMHKTLAEALRGIYGGAITSRVLRTLAEMSVCEEIECYGEGVVGERGKYPKVSPQPCTCNDGRPVTTIRPLLDIIPGHSLFIGGKLRRVFLCPEHSEHLSMGFHQRCATSDGTMYMK